MQAGSFTSGATRLPVSRLGATCVPGKCLHKKCRLHQTTLLSLLPTL